MQVINKRFTDAREFLLYCRTIGITHEHTFAKFVVLHNTGEPTLAQRPQGFSAQHIRNLKSYYEGLGWHAGPHVFVDDRGWVVFTPLTERGVHSFDWNPVSFGVEMLGDYNVEQFATGRGVLVASNAVKVVSVLSVAAGIDSSTMRLHKENTRTDHKDCPGKNVDKAVFIKRVHDYIVHELV